MKQIEGQMSLFDNIPGENGEKQQKQRKYCSGCAFFHEVVSGLGEIYHSTACLKDRPWARFKEPEDPACEYYTRAET